MRSKVFKMPSRRVLSVTISKWPSDSGLDDVLFKDLRFKTIDFKEMDKNITLSIDEMSIRSHMFYDIFKDKIVVFNSVNKDVEMPAKHVMVIMAQGLAKH